VSLAFSFRTKSCLKILNDHLHVPREPTKQELAKQRKLRQSGTVGTGQAAEDPFQALNEQDPVAGSEEEDYDDPQGGPKRKLYKLSDFRIGIQQRLTTVINEKKHYDKFMDELRAIRQRHVRAQ